MSESDDVKEFNKKFGLLVNEKPTHLTQRKLRERVECMGEELLEFVTAAEKQDLEGMTDALIDLVYFAKGTAVMMGLPWEQLWNDVQRANMAKVRGHTKRGHVADVKKPEGWEGPKTRLILFMSGYSKAAFADPVTGEIDERRCDDDDRPTR